MLKSLASLAISIMLSAVSITAGHAGDGTVRGGIRSDLARVERCIAEALNIAEARDCIRIEQGICMEDRDDSKVYQGDCYGFSHTTLSILYTRSVIDYLTMLERNAEFAQPAGLPSGTDLFDLAIRQERLWNDYRISLCAPEAFRRGSDTSIDEPRCHAQCYAERIFLLRNAFLRRRSR